MTGGERIEQDGWPIELSLLLDGALDAEDRERLDEELSRSPALRDDLADLQALSAIAKDASEPPKVSAGEWDQAWSRIAERTVRSPKASARVARLSGRLKAERDGRGRILMLPLVPRFIAAAAAVLVTATVLVPLFFERRPVPDEVARLERSHEPAPAISLQKATGFLRLAGVADLLEDEPVLAFSNAPGANEVEILELESAGDYSVTPLIPASSAMPVSILLNESL